LPGAILNTTGRRGGQGFLSVRGGESRHNKVIVDGVPVNEPGGIFDFGVVPTQEIELMEFVRGAVSALQGADTMTSVVQMWSASGRTPFPELRFGADGGNFGTAHGYASLAGVWQRLDYNLFGDQFNTEGQGINDAYSNSSQGANVGLKLTRSASLRLRLRHADTRADVQSFWKFNGDSFSQLPPDEDQYARQNNFLASLELSFATGSRWLHRARGFEYSHRRLNEDTEPDRGCDIIAFNFIDCPFLSRVSVNRAGGEYDAEYQPRSWARINFGYYFENEIGRFFNSFFDPFAAADQTSQTRGLRRNHEGYGQLLILADRLSVQLGGRVVRNESFGTDFVPRIAVSLVAVRGGSVFSETRLMFVPYSEGIKAPTFEESFGIAGAGGSIVIPNPELRPEQVRTFEAGIQQALFGGRHTLRTVYFHNRFRDLIQFSVLGPPTFESQFVNLNRSLAHGAELEWQARISKTISLNAGYVHNSTQLLEAPPCSPPFCDPLLSGAGAPLLRRPKHSGTLLATYLGERWGAHLGGSFVGRRTDSDFTFGVVPPFTFAEGYARLDAGGWYQLSRNLTAYVTVGNLLNDDYNEVLGFPALGPNFRAGMRFRFGRE
jgi:outer membrane receptor protein involved in Fe transport